MSDVITGKMSIPVPRSSERAGESAGEAVRQESARPLLPTVNSPDDLKRLSERELTQLAEELRRYIIE
ncbi:MAG TPA: 1-deoxy-D-xylulose-5-phosphate synthase N-terminal domain-containing protein, partial [Candidatus Polarisedimenticolia bacterium]